jgi:hypothetical protein
VISILEVKIRVRINVCANKAIIMIWVFILLKYFFSSVDLEEIHLKEITFYNIPTIKKSFDALVLEG